MARDTFLGSDTLPAATTKWNNNVAKDDALQAASGVAEGSSSIGTIPGTLPSGAIVAGDTLKNAVLKAYDEANASISASDVRHSGANGGRDADLGDDYDYRAASDAVLGTTNITTAGQATALGYPGVGLFSVQSTYSAGVGGGSVGRVRTVIISDGNTCWLTLWDNVDWTPLADILERPFSVTKNATTDWGAASGGVYTLTVFEAEHGLGSSVSVEVWDTTSVPGSRIQYLGAAVAAATGDITITAQETPDERVGLLVLVRAYA